MKEAKAFKSIAITGPPGSGKTETAKELARRLEWRAFGTGDIFRAYCKENELESVGAGSGSDEVHDVIDKRMVEVMQEGESIVEGRLACMLASIERVEDTFKIGLRCEPEERYRRIFEREPDKYASLETVRTVTIKREEENQRVFAERYDGRNYLDEKYYDVALNNTEISLEQSVNTLLFLMGLAQLEDEELLRFVELEDGEAGS